MTKKTKHICNDCLADKLGVMIEEQGLENVLRAISTYCHDKVDELCKASDPHHDMINWVVSAAMTDAIAYKVWDLFSADAEEAAEAATAPTHDAPEQKQ